MGGALVHPVRAKISRSTKSGSRYSVMQYFSERRSLVIGPISIPLCGYCHVVGLSQQYQRVSARGSLYINISYNDQACSLVYSIHRDSRFGKT